METPRTLEERLRELAGENARGMLIVDKQGRVVFADAGAEAFFQRKTGTLAGEALVALLAAETTGISLLGAVGLGTSIRMSEIEWEGKPAYLATLLHAQRNVAAPALDTDLHFREILQNSPDMIFINRRGVVDYINDAGVKMMRAKDASEIVGHSPLKGCPPELRSAVQARLDLMFSAPTVAPPMEQRIVALDGALIDVETRSASFYSGGEIVIQVISRDITARKATERALRTSVERFHHLAEAIPQIVWTSNPGGDVDYASPAFYKYSGIELDPSEAPGLRWLEAVHPADRSAIAAARVKGQQDGEPSTVELRIKRYDGEYRWHLVTASSVHDENGQLVKWFGTATDVHDRKLSEEAANKLAIQLLATLESMSDAFITLDRDWRVTYMNKEAEQLLRASRKAMVGQVVWDHFKGAEVFEAQYRRAFAENRMIEFDAPHAPLGIWVQVRAYPSEGGLAIYFRDVTEQRELEARLRQSQRMEVVGQLTGGIAHDFNNLLTVIMGNAEAMVERANNPTDRKLAEMTMTAAERGSELTSRLLAFARRQALDPKAIDVNALVEGMDGLLRRSLGEHVEIANVPGAGLWPAFVDAPQLEAALLNLTINARDAMPEGGRLTIETSNVTLDDSYARGHEEVTPGDYVMIAVSDTGFGMAPRIAARAFEPFFTTKEVGKGTGLGLSMVHGFVKQSGGHVKIYSEEGHGTTIKLYLPCALGSVERGEDASSEAIEGGSERILLVEDHEQVRTHVASQVEALGYSVVSVSTGVEALAVLERATFDLLFTDVVIPGGMNGPQLAREVQKRAPQMHVLFTSGYTENAVVHHGRLDPGVHLLNKPYRRSDLARKIRQALKPASRPQ